MKEALLGHVVAKEQSDGAGGGEAGGGAGGRGGQEEGKAIEEPVLNATVERWAGENGGWKAGALLVYAALSF